MSAASFLTRAAVGLLLTAAVIAVPPPRVARAGGDFVDLAADSSRVWFVGEAGIRELDANTGKVLATPQLRNAPYPDSVALAGGAAWIASVENGDIGGTLTRIDLRTRRARVVWHRADSAVFYTAAGAGSVWALIDVAGSAEIARFDLDGRLARTWRIPDAGRMAADRSGCWISTNQSLLHIDPAGKLHHVIRALLGDVATGAGAAWLPQTASVLRIDETSGRIARLPTGRLELGGFQHDLAAGNGALWALHQTNRARSTLEKLDPRTGRTTATAEIPGIGDAIIVTPTALWIATVIAPANRPATGYDLIRLDPQTLRRALLVHIT